MSNGYPPPPPSSYERDEYLEPHRGTTILVLGILSLIVCFICGIFAWSMANTDLAKMRAGVMDPSGRQETEIGKILGMIAVLLVVAGLGLFIIIAVIGGVASTSGY